MSPPELLPEIWGHIVTFLERKKPSIGTEDWKELHQDDLTKVMRVSKLLYDVTTPVLYREPVVQDLWSFFETSDNDNDASTHSQNSRASSFKYVKKLHLIHLPRTSSFFYSDLFRHLSLSENDTKEKAAKSWWKLSHLDDPSQRNYFLGTVAGFTSKQASTEKMMTFMSNSTSGKALRPEALTFGVWGDQSWDRTQARLLLEIQVPFVPNPLYKDYMKLFKGSLEDFSFFLRGDWGRIHQPIYHCSHVIGGPLGTCDQPFLTWGGADGPEVTVMHIHDGTLNFSYTSGGKNIIIYHDDTRCTHHDYAFELGNWKGVIKFWENGMKETLEEMKRRDPEFVSHGARETQIDIYGLPGNVEQKNSLQDLQEEMDAELELLKGMIKLYPYKEVPACVACGWSKDEEVV